MRQPGAQRDAGLVTVSRASVTRGEVDAVRDVTLTVGAGQWMGLVGPNGAGKSSLLLAMAGLIPFSGTITVDGLTPGSSDRRALARTVALMPQRPVVPDGATVAELVMLGRTPHIGRFSSEGPADRARVDDVLHRLDLHRFSHRVVTELSGGELQRVVLARALAQDPAVLLLDEPTSALDVGHQQQVLDVVESLCHEDGIAVLAAMHDLTLAAQYSDHLVLMDAGSVVAEGSPTAVLVPERLTRIYRARVDVLSLPGGMAVVPLPAHRKHGSGFGGRDGANAPDAPAPAHAPVHAPARTHADPPSSTPAPGSA